jgi:GntR family transcriptional regulator
MAPPLLFSLSPTSGVPIYRQLIDQVGALIASRRLLPGEFLPSVRQVAQDLQVNPMTVSKAYSLLEREGTVELVRGQGMRVNNVPANPAGLEHRQEALMPLLRQVAAAAYQLSLTREQVVTLLTSLLEESDHD